MIRAYIDMVIDLGLPHAYEEELQKSREFVEMFKVRNAPPEFVAKLFAEDKVKRAKTATLAAGFVYAHSAIDKLLTDMCKITTLEHLERWDKKINDRKPGFTMSHLKQNSYDDLRKMQVSEEFKRIERESILRRANLLIEICSQPTEWQAYKYESAKLKEFDDLRIKIIHYEIPKKLEKIFYNIMEYIHTTGYFFANIVSKSYSVNQDFDIQIRLMNPPVNDDALEELLI